MRQAVHCGTPCLHAMHAYNLWTCGRWMAQAPLMLRDKPVWTFELASGPKTRCATFQVTAAGLQGSKAEICQVYHWVARAPATYQFERERQHVPTQVISWQST